MLVNMNPKTKIRYGVISGNSINGDVLNEIYMKASETFTGMVCADFIERYGDHDEWDEQTQEEFDAEIEPDCINANFEYEGVKGQYSNSNGNIIMIFDSPVTENCLLCSPCYPNAGDLESPDEDGHETYTIPNDWRNE